MTPLKTNHDLTGWSAIDKPLATSPTKNWSVPYTGSNRGSSFDSMRDFHPSTPRRWKDIPAGALESLQETCGIEGLHQIIVIPWAERSVHADERGTMTANSVLAFGSRAVGLWTEEPEPGMKAVVLLEELAAIKDVSRLLYGKLSFLSRDGSVTLRYNTVARETLEPSLLELRRRLAGSAQPVPRMDRRSASLPFKWSSIVHSSLARLQTDAPVTFRFAAAPERSHGDITQAQLLMLNPWELVYVEEPSDSQYGSDSFIVSRSMISDARIEENQLAITANSVNFRLRMVPELRDFAAQWLLAGRNN